MRSVDHVWFEEFKEGSVCVVTLEFAHVLDVLELSGNKRAVGVAFTVNKRQHGVTVLPAILASKPTRGFREETHSEEQEHRRDHLQAPGDSEGCHAIDERGAVRNVEHD